MFESLYGKKRSVVVEQGYALGNCFGLQAIFHASKKLAQSALVNEGFDKVSSVPLQHLFSFVGHIFSPRHGNFSDQPFKNLILFLKGNAFLL